MQNKYRALITLTSLFRIYGWVTVIWTAVLVIMGAIVAFINGQYLGGGFLGFLGELLGAVWGSLMLLVFFGTIGGVLAVLYFAAAESIQVLLDIEKNTRSE